MAVARTRGPLDAVGRPTHSHLGVRPRWLPNYPGVLDPTRLRVGAEEPTGAAPAPPPPPTGFTPSLIPDRTRQIFREKNVDIPAGWKTKAAYDLSFFPELNKPTRGVLVVDIILDFKFEDGVSKLSPGAKLKWTAEEKTAYMRGIKNLCEPIWSEKHRLLTTATPLQPITDAGVIFQVHVEEGMAFFEHSHWNVHVEKTDKRIISSVAACGGGVFSDGEAYLDSLDLHPSDPPDLMQRAAVHEFGHMLGYRDEYPGAAVGPNPNFTADAPSILNTGEIVRPRHYVFFAAWLSKQVARSGSASSSSVWKVNGTIDLSNANV